MAEEARPEGVCHMAPQEEEMEAEEAAPARPLTREEIMALDDRPVHVVVNREWGPVILRGLTTAERASVIDAAAQVQADDLKGAPVMETAVTMVILSVVDETGARLFSEDDRADLMGKSGEVIQELAEAAMQFNGMTADAVEEAEKN